MDDILSILYGDYILPRIEDKEILQITSALYEQLTPAQGRQCLQAQKRYATNAFLLGVRTGAKLEHFLERDAPV